MDGLKQILSICDNMEKELDLYPDCITKKLLNDAGELHKLIERCGRGYFEIKEAALDRLHAMTLKSTLLVKVWLYSVLVNYTCKAQIMEEFLEYTVMEEKFSPDIKYFLYCQLSVKSFQNVNLETEKTKCLRWKLIAQIVNAFKEQMQDLLDYIPYEQRNPDLAFILSDQILSENHAVTKIALDKCKFLIEDMQKNVMLINTAESISLVGRIPYWFANESNYFDEYLEKQALEWKGTKIPFFQCEKNMPNAADLRAILEMVRNTKPGLIFTVSGNSIAANLIDSIIPVLTYGLTADLQETMTSCQTLCRNLEERDVRLINSVGISKDSIIQVLPKVSLETQKSVITRKKLRLPENKFLIAIIGNRLDFEIDKSFFDMLVCALDSEMAAVFIGDFQLYEKYMLQYRQLYGKVFFLGFSEDLLAWIEVFDLYLNPYRIGGGTSAVDALYKGIPVVTTGFGDVAVCAGTEFCTESYDTMPDLIKKYKQDKEFYRRMSVLSKKRAEELIDRPEDLRVLIEEFQKRTLVLKNR